jgi:hypothetical protein
LICLSTGAELVPAHKKSLDCFEIAAAAESVCEAAGTFCAFIAQRLLAAAALGAQRFVKR